jgi:hypothetical protein
VQGPEGTDTETKIDCITVESIPADFDGDGDVDQKDFGVLEACLSGAGVPPVGPPCEKPDLDGDDDVDQNDFSMFQGCMSGANVFPDPACLN